MYTLFTESANRLKLLSVHFHLCRCTGEFLLVPADPASILLQSALCLARLIYEDDKNKTPVPSGFALGLANERLGRRWEVGGEQDDGIYPLGSFPVRWSWVRYVPPSGINMPLQITFSILFFFFCSVTAPSPHPFRSSCNNTSFAATSLGLLHNVLCGSSVLYPPPHPPATPPPNTHLYEQPLCK